MKLIDAPVGVFVFRDELVLKTEYMTDIDGVYIPDCYILSTGEKFWGGMKSTEDFKTKYNNLDVEVIDIFPFAQPGQIHCYECKHYDTQECMGRNAFYGLKDDDYCSWAELRGEQDEAD